MSSLFSQRSSAGSSCPWPVPTAPGEASCPLTQHGIQVQTWDQPPLPGHWVPSVVPPLCFCLRVQPVTLGREGAGAPPPPPVGGRRRVPPAPCGPPLLPGGQGARPGPPLRLSRAPCLLPRSCLCLTALLLHFFLVT